MRTLISLLIIVPLFSGAPPVRKEVIRVPAWVQAGDVEPESALGLESITVNVSGAAVRPVALLGPSDDLMLLVVTDMTGDLTLAELAKRALNERIYQLPSNALVGLLQSQDGLRVLVDPTSDQAAVKAAIDVLGVSGKAGLLETIQTAAEMGDKIMAKAAVRLAVLYVTDSDVGNYREDFTNPVVNWSDQGDMSRRFRDGLVREKISKLDASLGATVAPIFILHLAYRTDVLNQAYQTGLMTLAATTGGASYFCRSQTEIADAMGKAFDAIASLYSIEVRVPAGAPKVVDIVLESPGRALTWRSRFSLSGP